VLDIGIQTVPETGEAPRFGESRLDSLSLPESDVPEKIVVVEPPLPD